MHFRGHPGDQVTAKGCNARERDIAHRKMHGVRDCILSKQLSSANIPSRLTRWGFSHNLTYASCQTQMFISSPLLLLRKFEPLLHIRKMEETVSHPRRPTLSDIMCELDNSYTSSMQGKPQRTLCAWRRLTHRFFILMHMFPFLERRQHANMETDLALITTLNFLYAVPVSDLNDGEKMQNLYIFRENQVELQWKKGRDPATVSV